MSGLRTTTAIVEAITTKHLLAFDYHGRARVVEPHTFGLDRWGRSLLCQYHRVARHKCRNANKRGEFSNRADHHVSETVRRIHSRRLRVLPIAAPVESSAPSQIQRVESLLHCVSPE